MRRKPNSTFSRSPSACSPRSASKRQLSPISPANCACRPPMSTGFSLQKPRSTKRSARRLFAVTEVAGDGIVKNSEPVRQKLRALLAMMETANEQRFLSNRKLHDLLERSFSENWPIAREHTKKITKLLYEIISQGKRDGVFAVGDCERAATIMRSASIRFWHPRQAVEGAQEPEPTLDEMIDFCLAAFAQGRPRQIPKTSTPPIRRFNATRQPQAKSLLG